MYTQVPLHYERQPETEVTNELFKVTTGGITPEPVALVITEDDAALFCGANNLLEAAELLIKRFDKSELKYEDTKKLRAAINACYK